MSNGYNGNFRTDPFGLVSRCAINNVSMAVANAKTAKDFPKEQRGSDGRITKASPFTAYNNSLTLVKSAFDGAKCGEFDIEPRTLASGSVLYMRYFSPGYSGTLKEPPFSAHWCPYDTEQGVVPSEIPYVDLLKSAPTHNLMLTGSMQGCSLVVTLPQGQPDILRVYHDFKHKTHSFKDEVVICRIDYTDEVYDSANAAEPAATAPTRTRSGSLSSSSAAKDAPTGRSRSASFHAPAPAARCVRFSYGDNTQFKAADSGGAAALASGAKLSTAFNFLYYDTIAGKWTAVSQPLDFVTSGGPKKAWYEPESVFLLRQDAYNADIRKNGQQVAMAPARAPWRCLLPY